MRLHSSAIEALIRLYTTYGGHREETRLRQELRNFDLSTYTRQDGQVVIVETRELNKQVKGS